MCTRALCSSSSFCVMRLQLAFVFDLQLAHGCASTSKMVFCNCLLERLIPYLHVCAIPLHTLLIHCRDVHTFVEAQVFISGNFVFQMLVVRFRLVVFPIAHERSSISRPLLRLWEGAAFSFASICSCIFQVFCLNIGSSFPGRLTFDVHGWSSACT